MRVVKIFTEMKAVRSETTKFPPKLLCVKINAVFSSF
jgi:hypothetical protein